MNVWSWIRIGGTVALLAAATAYGALVHSLNPHLVLLWDAPGAGLPTLPTLLATLALGWIAGRAQGAWSRHRLRRGLARSSATTNGSTHPSWTAARAPLDGRERPRHVTPAFDVPPLERADGPDPRDREHARTEPPREAVTAGDRRS